MRFEKLSRRRFLAGTAFAIGGAGWLLGRDEKSAPAERKRSGQLRVAAVVTEYRPWSHADVICGRFIQGYSLDVSPHWPPVAIRAMYVDQFPPADLSRALSKQYGFPIVGSIREAILDASGKVDVDGVLLIGEHGNYPQNDREQTLYPRRRFFEETVAAFDAAGEVVPVFNDKHLAARWEDAKFMYETAKAKRIPFLAGSSVPLAWRRPWLEIPIGTPMDEALSVGYGGIEAYGFHALEALQSMVERRRGGEVGVAAVQCLEGKAVWDAMHQGRFSRELLAAALRRHEPAIEGDFESKCPQPVAYFIEYTDGFKATCLVLNNLASRFLFSAKLTGDVGPVSTELWLQEPTFGHFAYLTNAIIEMVRTGKPPYPVERTVLTTGILSTAMDSRFEKGRRIETPDLKAIAYAPVDHDLGAYRHPEATNARDGGWIELFNGRDLDGWRENRFEGDPRWTVNDGILSGRGGQGYVATLEEFGDFELVAEVRIAGAAGGRGKASLGFRCQPHLDRKQASPPGYEARCDHDDPDHYTGSIGDLDSRGAHAPKPRVKDGEWFRLRLLASGNRFQTWVNGEAAADCRDEENRFRRGCILLRVRDGTAVADFREVRVRRV